MKTQEQIERRLQIAKQELATWRNELNKGISGEYSDYCRGIVREFKAQVDLLEWILSTP